MSSPAVLIKACLNGSRAPGSHPALPLTPAELAAAASTAVLAGAGAVHVHPRAADGSQSHSPQDVAAAVTAIRAACPGLPVGVTTGAWIARDPARRLDEVARWYVLPDFASVNWFEDGALDLARLLVQRGVGVEAGIGTVADARTFAASGIADRCLRVLVEVRERDGMDAVRLAAAIEEALVAGGVQIPRLHHGFGPDTWRVLAAAFERGRDVRIGLEDTLTMPDGTEAPDNAALVAAAVSLARRHGREPLAPGRGS